MMQGCDLSYGEPLILTSFCSEILVLNSLKLEGNSIKPEDEQHLQVYFEEVQTMLGAS